MNDGHPEGDNKNIFTKIINGFGRKRREDDVTEEILDMVNEGHEQVIIKETEAQMIGNIIEFKEKQAEDVMTNRKSVVALDSRMTVEEAFEFVIKEKYSRYPVYKDNIDNIIGVLHLRDLLKVYQNEDTRNTPLEVLKHHILFDVTFTPGSRNIDALFKGMQSKKVHMAVVVDEYGQTAGIVTMEDILEEIVGNILDEYDDEEILINKQDDGSYIVDGSVDLEELEKLLDIEFDCDDIETINGYITYKMGRIPKENDSFKCECMGYSFEILEVKDKVVDKLVIKREPDNKKEGEEENE